MEVGGLYHTIQVDLRGCSSGVLEVLLVSDDCDGFALIPPSIPDFEFSLRLFSLIVDGVGLQKSSDVPGVLGVLLEDPNDANAPEPKPNAEEAPFVGDATLLVVNGAMPLKGLDLLLKDPSPPNRFADW